MTFPRRYVLESRVEAERLERQSKSSLFSLDEELGHFEFGPESVILDAGCGSGVAARVLASKLPRAQVIGCDRSEERIRFARGAAQAEGVTNAKFTVADLTTQTGTGLSSGSGASDGAFGAGRFDHIVCRYVLEHLAPAARAQALRNLLGLLADEGSLYVIDVDGILANLHPQTPWVAEVIRKITDQSQAVDLHIGRKLPTELREAGFGHVEWQIRTLAVTPERMPEEIALTEERLAALSGYLGDFLGGQGNADRFKREYVESMRHPGAVLFYNMFLIRASAQPPGPGARPVPRLVTT